MVNELMASKSRTRSSGSSLFPSTKKEQQHGQFCPMCIIYLPEVTRTMQKLYEDNPIITHKYQYQLKFISYYDSEYSPLCQY